MEVMAFAGLTTVFGLLMLAGINQLAKIARALEIWNAEVHGVCPECEEECDGCCGEDCK